MLMEYMFTRLSNFGVIAAAVVKVPSRTVLGERVHHSGSADGMDERSFPCG